MSYHFQNFKHFPNFQNVILHLFVIYYCYIYFKFVIIAIIIAILEKTLSLTNFEINYYCFLYNNYFNFHLVYIEIIIIC